MAENKVYATDAEIRRATNMYSITDKEYQNVCVAYMYGRSLQEADELRETLTETEIANANDYMMTKGLPQAMRNERYEKMIAERNVFVEKHGISPVQAIVARDNFDDLVKAKDGGYDLTSDEGKAAACKMYSRLEQNNLTSFAVKKMDILDAMAENAGLKFNMTNESSYRLPNAMVTPKFELVANEEDLSNAEFADAVAGITEEGQQMGQ